MDITSFHKSTTFHLPLITVKCMTLKNKTNIYGFSYMLYTVVLNIYILSTCHRFVASDHVEV